MRSYMRDVALGREPNLLIPAAVGMDEESMVEMYHLMAIAKYADRYVIPTAHREEGHQLEELACSLDYDDGPACTSPARSVRRAGVRPRSGGDLPSVAATADQRPCRR